MKHIYRLILPVILFNVMPYMYGMDSLHQLAHNDSHVRSSVAMQGSSNSNDQTSTQSMLAGLITRMNNQDAIIVGLQNQVRSDHSIIEALRMQLHAVKSSVHDQDTQLVTIKDNVDEHEKDFKKQAIEISSLKKIVCEFKDVDTQLENLEDWIQNLINKTNRQGIVISRVKIEVDSLKKPSTRSTDVIKLISDIKGTMQTIQAELSQYKKDIYRQIIELDKTKNVVNEHSEALDKLEDQVDKNTECNQKRLRQMIDLRKSIIREHSSFVTAINQNTAFNRGTEFEFNNLRESLLGSINDLEMNLLIIKNELQANIQKLKPLSLQATQYLEENSRSMIDSPLFFDIDFDLSHSENLQIYKQNLLHHASASSSSSSSSQIPQAIDHISTLSGHKRSRPQDASVNVLNEEE